MELISLLVCFIAVATVQSKRKGFNDVEDEWIKKGTCDKNGLCNG